MDDLSYFESRQGKLACTVEEVFNFVSDIRNFEQFVHEGTISNWQAEKDSCSFNVSMLGTVTFRLAEKEEYKRVVFKGDALKKNDFSLTLYISVNDDKSTGVRVTLDADLNPMLKMMAAKPIAQFLEMLVSEMEKFNGWDEIKKN